MRLYGEVVWRVGENDGSYDGESISYRQEDRIYVIEAIEEEDKNIEDNQIKINLQTC